MNFYREVDEIVFKSHHLITQVPVFTLEDQRRPHGTISVIDSCKRRSGFVVRNSKFEHIKDFVVESSCKNKVVGPLLLVSGDNL